MNPRKNASEYVSNIHIYITLPVPYINNHSQLPAPPGFLFFFPLFPFLQNFFNFLIFLYIYIYLAHTHTHPMMEGRLGNRGGGCVFLKIFFSSFSSFSFLFLFSRSPPAHKKRLDGDPPPSHLSLVMNNSRYLFLL